jgi:hypothetical protein
MCAGCVNNAEFLALNVGFVSGGLRAAIQRIGLKYFGKAPLQPVTDAEVDAFLRRIGAPVPERPRPWPARVSAADPAPRRRKLAPVLPAVATCACGGRHHHSDDDDAPARRGELVGASA